MSLLSILQKTFNLDISEFPFDKYIEDEAPDFLGLGTLIRKYIFGNKSKEVEKLTVSNLIDWVERGYFKSD